MGYAKRTKRTGVGPPPLSRMKPLVDLNGLLVPSETDLRHAA
jgi:hypothetical protein